MTCGEDMGLLTCFVVLCYMLQILVYIALLLIHMLDPMTRRLGIDLVPVPTTLWLLELQLREPIASESPF